jgi:branched-chain amino acid aminotransferase
MKHAIYNGIARPAGAPLLPAHPAFLPGYSVFETMRLHGGRIALADGHAARLEKAMQALGLETAEPLTAQRIVRDAAGLARQNGLGGQARIRLTVFRESGLHPATGVNGAGWMMTADVVDPPAWHEQGLAVAFYEAAAKSSSPWSAFKTGSRILYDQAARHAAAHGLDDALIANGSGCIVDSTDSSVFIVRDGRAVTSPVAAGGVDGVARRHVLRLLQSSGQPAGETVIAAADVLSADEVFLTNAVRGLRWVRQCGEKTYGYRFARELFARLSALFG